MEWCEAVANERVHGTTKRRPKVLLEREQAGMLDLPERSGLAPYPGAVCLSVISGG